MSIPTPTPRETVLMNMLLQAAPLPIEEGKNGQFRIKITSERGSTVWMNITPKQFKRIEQVMLSELDD